MGKKRVMITLCASYMLWPNLVGEGKRDIQGARADLEDCPLRRTGFPHSQRKVMCYFSGLISWGHIH